MSFYLVRVDCPSKCPWHPPHPWLRKLSNITFTAVGGETPSALDLKPKEHRTLWWSSRHIIESCSDSNTVYDNYDHKDHQVSFFHINSECPKVQSKHWHAPKAFWWTVFWLCTKTRAEIMLASHLRYSGWEAQLQPALTDNHRPLEAFLKGRRISLSDPAPRLLCLIGAMLILALSTGLSLWRWRWVESWTLETLPAPASFSHICPISWKSTRCFWRVKSQLVHTAAPNTAFQKKLKSSSKVLDSSHQRVRRLLGGHYHLSLLKSTYCTYRREMLKCVALKSERHYSAHAEVENKPFLLILRY